MDLVDDYVPPTPVYLCTRCLARVDEVEAGGVGYCDRCRNTMVLIRVYEKEMKDGE